MIVNGESLPVVTIELVNGRVMVLYAKEMDETQVLREVRKQVGEMPRLIPFGTTAEHIQRYMAHQSPVS